MAAYSEGSVHTMLQIILANIRKVNFHLWKEQARQLRQHWFITKYISAYIVYKDCTRVPGYTQLVWPSTRGVDRSPHILLLFGQHPSGNHLIFVSFALHPSGKRFIFVLFGLHLSSLFYLGNIRQVNVSSFFVWAISVF